MDTSAKTQTTHLKICAFYYKSYVNLKKKEYGGKIEEYVLKIMENKVQTQTLPEFSSLIPKRVYRDFGDKTNTTVGSVSRDVNRCT